MENLAGSVISSNVVIQKKRHQGIPWPKKTPWLSYAWWFRNPVNSPVEVGIVYSTVIYRVLGYIPDGLPDFWTINSRKSIKTVGALWMEIHQYFRWCRNWKKSLLGLVFLPDVFNNPYARAPLYQTPSAWCWSPPDLQEYLGTLLGWGHIPANEPNRRRFPRLRLKRTTYSTRRTPEVL